MNVVFSIRQNTARTAFIAALAMILLVMQSLALVHRVAHAAHGEHRALQAMEPWLVVANGGVISESNWASLPLSPQAGVSHDPWHHHETAVDCDRFDAVCAANALLGTTSPPILPTPDNFVVSRTYVADLVARSPRAQARAPPRA